MESKIELLKDLLEISILTPQLKLNKIIQTLINTEDMMKAKMLSERILKGDFNDLKEKSITDLIGAFALEDKDKVVEADIEENNKNMNLEYELKSFKLKFEAMEHNYNKKIKDLEEANYKLKSSIVLTKNFSVIDVPDEDINELYLKNLENGNTSYKDAFIINGVIPKSYYKIK